jgi:undecaprenyl-diphosphatase
MGAPYVARLFGLVRAAALALVRPPTSVELRSARQQALRQGLLVLAAGAAAIVALMFLFDATEIALMPARGSPGLWPWRVLTDFGKDAYVLWGLSAALIAVALALPLLSASAQPRWRGFAARLGYLWLAVELPVLIGELVKWMVGRGRPFVGGQANPFNFMPFAGNEAHYSFPSAHAITAFALAFGVGAIWPRWRGIMLAYAILIACSRLVLLAHHPSDVVGGGLIGVLGAIAVRYWFAARGLVFAIGADGRIGPPSETAISGLKGVAQPASGP